VKQMFLWLVYRPRRRRTCRYSRDNCYNPAMSALSFLLLPCLASLAVEPESGHAKNPVFAAIVQEGVDLGGIKVRLPAPRLKDGQEADVQQAALLEVAGSEEALSDLLRDSVTAPFILKVHDAKADDGTVRLVDLWFAVRGDLDRLDPTEVARKAGGQVTGAGNMEFESRLLTSDELAPRGKSTLTSRELSRWFEHVDGRLLDRVEVAATAEVVASRTAESLVIASRTDRAFDTAGALANRYRELRQGSGESDRVYRGGISYARIGRLKRPEGALLVEVHAAFSEPQAWFQGAPILRSKFAPIAQDQIRRLRRELQKDRSKSAR
jgi:hypothetical protein